MDDKIMKSAIAMYEETVNEIKCKRNILQIMIYTILQKQKRNTITITEM